MKKIVLSVLMVLVLAGAASAGEWIIKAAPNDKIIAEQQWGRTVRGGDVMLLIDRTDFVILDINGKTQLRVWSCGKVEVMEYKEVVKNKDADTISFSTGGDVITLPGWTTTLENHRVLR